MPAIQLFPRQLWWGNRPCNFGEIGRANVGKHDLQLRGKISCKKQRRLSKTLEARWVVECIEEAKKCRIGAEPLIVHSDRGSQYISDAYLEALGKIRPSPSRKASPWQNACNESFHALIKREWLYSLEIADFDHAYKLVFEYINAFYNTVRSHSHCNYLSPAQYKS